MRLNELKPNDGSKRDRKRVGRGIGSGSGKTGGRGHKGQKSRNNGGSPRGFEGGQMPLQRRLPKFGFTSRVSRFRDEIRVAELAGVESDVIDLDALRTAGLIGSNVQTVKVFLSGTLAKPVKLKGLGVTKGARAAIEAAGGSIED